MDARYCLPCEKPTDAAVCSACGSKTFDKNDPQIREVHERHESERTEAFDSKISFALAFVIGVPLWFSSVWALGDIPGTLVAALGVFGAVQLAHGVRKKLA